LQRVGNIDWLLDKFQFETLAGAMDELVILSTHLNDDEIEDFLRAIDRIQQRFFIPISIGGQIRNKSDADRLFRAGADKVVLNNALHLNLGLCKEIIQPFIERKLIRFIPLD
jgi:cyclase